MHVKKDLRTTSLFFAYAPVTSWLIMAGILYQLAYNYIICLCTSIVNLIIIIINNNSNNNNNNTL